jgi:rubrerythrin
MRFCVISYDDGEQQTFTDFVEAAGATSARQIVGEVRGDYADTVDAMDADELRDIAARLEEDQLAPASAQALRRHLKFDCGATEFDEYFCRECGADKEEQAGDGYDGLCPSCADKAEREGAYS